MNHALMFFKINIFFPFNIWTMLKLIDDMKTRPPEIEQSQRSLIQTRVGLQIVETVQSVCIAYLFGLL